MAGIKLPTDSAIVLRYWAATLPQSLEQLGQEDTSHDLTDIVLSWSITQALRTARFYWRVEEIGNCVNIIAVRLRRRIPRKQRVRLTNDRENIISSFIVGEAQHKPHFCFVCQLLNGRFLLARFFQIRDNLISF